MDPPPATSSSPSSASVPMVVITVVGIFAAFALLASYYAFVTKCQLLHSLSSRYPPWRGLGARRRAAAGREASVIRTVAAEDRGLGLPFIRMLPVVKFTAAADAGDGGAMAGRISVSECAVCLSEFVERERVRLLPNCSHAFHIDCIDTWLQGNSRCPFCRSDVTLPPRPSSFTPAAPSTRSPCGGDADADRRRRRDDELVGNSIVIEVRGEHESWVSHGAAGSGGGRRGRKHGHHQQQQRRRKAESVGDEAIDTRKKDEAFAVQPLRRSLSMDSSCDKPLYVSVQELLAAAAPPPQRQV